MHPGKWNPCKGTASRRRLAAVVFAGLAAILLAAAPPVATAPDFELGGLDGATIRLSELRGKTVVLHFWATWCPHCLSEMPILEEAAPGLRSRDVEVLAINLGEPRKKVDRYVREHELTLKVLLDRGGKVAEAYRVIGLPATILVDPAGRVVRQIEMGSLSKSELEKLPSLLADVVRK
jgi:peroxiredoxin